MIDRLEAAGLTYAKGPDQNHEVTFWCPFHAEGDTPDLSFNLSKRVYHCFPCGGGGSEDQLLQRLRDLEPTQAEEDSAPRSGLSEFLDDPPRPVRELMKNPQPNHTAGDTLRTAYGLRDETLGRFEIRADESRRGWVYPVEAHQRVKNFDRSAKPKYRWVGLAPGASRLLYGAVTDPVLDGRILLLNGEPSVWVATQAGMPAFSTVSGEGTPLPADTEERLQALGVKNVVVVPDNDQVGRTKGAERAARLADSFEVTVITLPDEVGEKGDLADLYRVCGFDDARLRDRVDALVAAAGANPSEDISRFEVSPKETAPKSNYPVYSAPQLLDLRFPPQRWRVDRLLPEEGVLTVVGMAGAGKSWLMLDLAIAIAGGRSWLGFEVTAGRVLYLDEEMGLSLLQTRVGLLEMNPPDALHFVSRQGIRIDRPKHIAALEALLDDVRPDVVLFDSFVRFHGAEENSATELANVFRVLTAMREKFHFSVIFVDHMNRPGGSRSAAERLRGSGDKQAYADAILNVNQISPDPLSVRLVHSKSRADVPVADFVVTLERNGGQLRLVNAGAAKTLDLQPTAMVQPLIREVLAASSGLTKTELHDAVLAHAPDAKVKHIDDGLVVLLKAKTVVKRSRRSSQASPGRPKDEYLLANPEPGEGE